MKEYTITADRVTKDYGIVTFRVEADSLEEAIQLCENCEAEEIDWSVNKANGYDTNYREGDI